MALVAVCLMVVYLFNLGQKHSEAAGTTITISDAGGNWDDPAAWVGGVVPDSTDDVIATATSGPLVINVAASCRSIDLSAYISILTHNAATSLSVGDASGGALNFSGTWAYTKGDVATSSISFVSTNNNSTNGWPITWGGKVPGNLNFNGVGGKWTYQDGYENALQYLVISAGELDTNSQSFSAWKISFANSADAIMTMGNSTITLASHWNESQTPNYILNAGTSTIIMAGTDAVFYGTGKTYSSVIFNGPGTQTIGWVSTFVNLTRTGTESKNDAFVFSPQTITGTLTLAGNSPTNRLLVKSNILGTSNTLTAATLSASNVDFMDTTAGGAANWNLSAIPGGSGDCGGNVGITFTTSATQTWANPAGGNWSLNTNWTSRVPLPQDNVSFALAFNTGVTVNSDMPRLGKSISWTGATWGAGTATRWYTGGIVVTSFGSLTLIPGMTYDQGGSAYVFSGRSQYTLTTSGKYFYQLYLSAPGGTYTLNGSLAGGYVISIDSGNFVTAGNSVTVENYFSSTGSMARSVDIRNSTLTISANGGWWMADTGLTFEGSGSTILSTYTGASSTYFRGGSKTYNNISLSPGPSIITFSGAFTFNNMTMSSAGAKTVMFASNTAYTMTGTKFLSGTAGNLITIDSDDGATQFTISKASGIVAGDYISISRSNVTGGAIWYATAFSLPFPDPNVSGNTGWTASGTGSVKTISAVGGNWNAIATWNEGAIPTAADNVVALPTSGASTISASIAVRSIDMSAYTKTLTHSSAMTLSVGDASGGAFNFTGAWTYTKGSTTTSAINFISSSNNGGNGWNVTWGGKTPGNIAFNAAAGKWIFQDGYTATAATLTVTAGTVDINGKNLSLSVFSSSNSNTRSITLGAAAITCASASGWTFATATNLTFSGASSTINMAAANATFAGGGKTFGTVSFAGAGSLTVSGANTFGAFTRTGTAVKTDSLIFNAAQIISGRLTVTGNSAINRVLASSNAIGTPVTITADNVTLSNVDFMDITFAGTMTKNSATSIGDCGGNSGVNWASIVTAAAPQTWTNAAGGNWSAASNWTSRVPLPQDDAIMNRVGGYDSGVTLTADMPRLGRTIDWTGAIWNGDGFQVRFTSPANASLRIFGSLILSPLTWNANFANARTTWYFSGRAAYSISADVMIENITIEAPSGSYTLVDDLYVTSTLSINCGSLISSGHNIDALSIVSSNTNTRSIDIRNSEVRLSYSAGTTWNFATTTGLTFDATGSTIVISYSGSSASTFAGGNLAYGNIIIYPGTGITTFSGAFSFETMSMYQYGSSTKTVKFTKNTTYTMTGSGGYFLSGKSAGTVVTIDTNDGTGQFTLSKTSGGVTADYVSISRSNITGSGKWYLSNTSTSVTGNTGWSSDAIAPSNPTVSSVTVGGVAVTPSAWINYSGAAVIKYSGAADSDSGIVGYYTYYGTNAAGDPATYAAHSGAIGDLQTRQYIAVNTSDDGSHFYFRVKAKDAAGNLSAVTTAFEFQYDRTVPIRPAFAVSDPAGYSAINSFGISWPAASDPLGAGGSAAGIKYYEYKRAVDESWSHTSDQDQHVVAGIQAYQEGANVFYVRSVDNAGNISPDYQQISYYWLGTVPPKPDNLTVTPGNSSTNLFTISWDRPTINVSDPMIIGYYYSVNARPTLANVRFVENADSHVSLLADAYATLQGTNTVYVLGVNQAGKYSFDESNFATVTFICNTAAQPAPVQTSIIDSSDSNLSRWMLTLQWEAGEGQTDAFDHYIIYRSTDGLGFTELATTNSTAYIDNSNLNNSTTYYYNIKAVDNASKQSAQSTTVSKIPTGVYLTPPTYLTAPSVSGIKSASAKITWMTDRPSSSIVRYGKNMSMVDSSGSLDSVTSHEVVLTGLEAGSEYCFQVQSLDEKRDYSPEDAYSLVNYFSTMSSPMISQTAIGNITLTSADVSFSTTTVSSSTLNYGVDSTYGKQIDDISGDQTTTHSIRLGDLAPGTTYHFRIKGTDIDGNVLSSDDYQFDTLPLPEVADLKIEPVSDKPASAFRASWTTNVPTTTILKYKTGSDEFKESVKSKQETSHSVEINGLLDSSEYSIQASGRDPIGNLAESDIRKFTTPFDTRPAIVSSVTIETSNVGLDKQDKAQIAVSWKTDEPTTSQIEYSEGITGSSYTHQTAEDKALTTSHLIIISDLTPQKPYHLRVLVADKGNNITKSEDHTIIPGDVPKSALQVILHTFTRLFGWMGM